MNLIEQDWSGSSKTSYLLGAAVGIASALLMRLVPGHPGIIVAFAVSAVCWRWAWREGALCAVTAWGAVAAAPPDVHATIVRFSIDAVFTAMVVWGSHHLRHERRRLVRFLDAIPQLAWVTDTDGTFIYFNRRWLEYTGQTEREALDNPRGCVHPADMATTLERFNSALRTGAPYENEVRLRRSDGQYRWYLSRATPKLDEYGRKVAWVGTSTDIHEVKVAASMLVQQERLATVGRLAATIAHEINNPLEAITNLLYLAQRCQAEHERSELIAQALAEAERCGAIVGSTLSISKDTRQPSTFSLKSACEAVGNLLYRKIQNRGVELTMDLDPSASIFGLESDLKQVITNLLSNAIDATPRGGRIGVKTCVDEHGTRLEVCDTGSGIPEEVRARLFEPFFTTKGDNGTGLGLWVTEELVQKNGGRIQVESEDQKGSRFVVMFPAPGSIKLNEVHAPS